MSRKCSILVLLWLLGCLSAPAQGLTLFSPEVRQSADYTQRVVMDFVERYFGQELPALRHTTTEHKMADDKVYFRQGSLADLRQVSDTLPFSIRLLDRHYEVAWQQPDGAPLVTVVFPAQYDLLLGLSKDEAANQLRAAIMAAPPRSQQRAMPDSLQQIDDSTYQHVTSHFELESLNDAIYYNKVREDSLPVFDAQRPAYSAANLFQGLIASADYRMYVEQAVYGMKTVGYTLTLRQWLDYCALLGLKVYFGIEEQRADGLLAVVIAQSAGLGFNHLLSVVIPDRFVTDPDVVLKVRLTPYIPAHNVKELYQQESSTHQKQKWQ